SRVVEEGGPGSGRPEPDHRPTAGAPRVGQVERDVVAHVGDDPRPVPRLVAGEHTGPGPRRAGTEDHTGSLTVIRRYAGRKLSSRDARPAAAASLTCAATRWWSGEWTHTGSGRAASPVSMNAWQRHP